MSKSPAPSPPRMALIPAGAHDWTIYSNPEHLPDLPGIWTGGEEEGWRAEDSLDIAVWKCRAVAVKKLRPRSCLAQVLGVGERTVLPNSRLGCKVCHWVSALASKAVTLAGPAERACAARAVGDNEGSGGVGGREGAEEQ